MNRYDSQSNNYTDCHIYPRHSETGKLDRFFVTSATPATAELSRVHARLVEAGLSVERFIDLREETKESPVDPTKPVNQYGAEEIEGTYGVMPLGSLVFVDVDDWEALPSEAEDLLHDYPTFTVTSPHADDHEGHYWFIVEGDITNSRFDWGEIRASGWYVVGPGSEITECDYGCCTPDTPGLYETDHDRPIAQIPVDEFRDALLGEESKETDISDCSTNSFTGNLDARIERGLSENADFRELWEWAKRGGDPAEVGFPDGDDGEGRSGAETALGAHLMFWLSGDWNAVREAFTQVQSPKWSESDESYKQSLLGDADNGVYYNPERKGNSISSEAITEVTIALQLHCEGKASTAEVAAQEPVNIQEGHTRRVLAMLDDMGYLHYEQDGRTGYWVVDNSNGLLEYTNSSEIDRRFNSRQDRLEWCKEHL